MIRRHFHRVNLRGDFNDRGLPVLMIGNHFSWWDGFIANMVNIRLLHRKPHIMILEEQLAGRKFLNKAGAYSIKKGSRSAIESLNYSAELLSSKDNLVIIYPQGEFQSIYQHPVSFEKGIDMVVSQVRNSYHILFYAALVDYFSHRKPSLTIYYREFSKDPAVKVEGLESEYNSFLKECILQQNPD